MTDNRNSSIVITKQGNPMKMVFLNTCPLCETEMEIPLRLFDYSITCPNCDVPFTPNKEKLFLKTKDGNLLITGYSESKTKYGNIFATGSNDFKSLEKNIIVLHLFSFGNKGEQVNKYNLLLSKWTISKQIINLKYNDVEAECVLQQTDEWCSQNINRIVFYGRDGRCALFDIERTFDISSFGDLIFNFIKINMDTAIVPQEIQSVIGMTCTTDLKKILASISCVYNIIKFSSKRKEILRYTKDTSIITNNVMLFCDDHDVINKAFMYKKQT